jgi:hypothetical protein
LRGLEIKNDDKDRGQYRRDYQRHNAAMIASAKMTLQTITHPINAAVA